MLILTRRPGETLVLTDENGNESTVTVLNVTGNQVRLGITAPISTTIDREEIHQRKMKEQANSYRVAGVNHV